MSAAAEQVRLLADCCTFLARGRPPNNALTCLLHYTTPHHTTGCVGSLARCVGSSSGQATKLAAAVAITQVLSLALAGTGE